MDWPDKAYDVVYLDPMFPADRRKASSRKEMTMLQNIATEHQSESELLSQSLRCARRRVVVKRNRRSPELGGTKPTLKFQEQVEIRRLLLLEQALKDELIDGRKLLNIGNPHPFIELVYCGIAGAYLNNLRTGWRDESTV